jgi:hypothetical protein
MVLRRFRNRGASLPPEIQELQRALKDGSNSLGAAEKAHANTIKEIRKQLRDAERAHQRAVGVAQDEVDLRRKEREQRVRQAQKRYESIRATLAPMEISRFGKSVLYEDRIVTKHGEALLDRGVTALADTAARIAIARPGAVARLAATGAVNGRAFRTAQGYDARRFYLLVEAPELVALLPCRNADEQTARDFAARVNVAALNARRIDRERDEALGDAQRELDVAEGYQDVVQSADEEVVRVMAETEAIDLARGRLEEAEADTEAINAQREQVAALQLEHDDALASEHARVAEERRIEEERRVEAEKLREQEEEKNRAEEAKRKRAEQEESKRAEDEAAAKAQEAKAEKAEVEGAEVEEAEAADTSRSDQASDESNAGAAGAEVLVGTEANAAESARESS